MTQSAQPTPAQALIRRIDDGTQEELDKILSAATEEAATKVRAAHKKARRRIRQEIETLRRAREEARRQTEAQLDTIRRQLRQREAGTVIETGLPILRRMLLALWSEHDTRKGWIENIMTAAASRLRPGQWAVEHPVGWAEDERAQAALRIKDISGQEPVFRSVADLEAGLVLLREHVRLDASVNAIARNPDETGAALLAVLLENAEEAQ